MIKNSQLFVTKFQKTVGGIFWLTLYWWFVRRTRPISWPANPRKCA